ncbi:MAG: hypothetical protein CSA75_01520 [Sorangium cellulosum]|nr:MAG: hypothetical protein CSA75_01520 [Sorangium cellulosum]
MMVVGCASKPIPKLSAKPTGCQVTVYRGAMPEPITVTVLGDVAASCGKHDADSDCIRALQDEVCKLGGNVVFEVPEKAERETEMTLRYTGVAGAISEDTSP